MIQPLASVLRAMSQPRVPVLEPLLHPLRVWPMDLNLGGHMDNVRYLKLMDRARNEYFLRTGLARLALVRRINMPVAASQVRYRRSLFLGQAYTLHTHLAGWDEKWFVIEQHIVREGELITHGLFKCVFLGRDGAVPPADVFARLCNRTKVSPALAPGVQQWLAS